MKYNFFLISNNTTYSLSKQITSSSFNSNGKVMNDSKQIALELEVDTLPFICVYWLMFKDFIM